MRKKQKDNEKTFRRGLGMFCEFPQQHDHVICYCFALYKMGVTIQNGGQEKSKQTEARKRE